MRFQRLSVKHVRGIESAELDFGPGLNVLYGPNDIGKSTLVAAVRAALLLQYSSVEGQSLVPWVGDFVPQVELTFEREGQVWRVQKTFGAGTRGSARLELRDGAGYRPQAKAREVEERLRNLLEWGIPPPGGNTRQKGLPRPFLAQALIGEQQDVEGILEASLEADGTDAGRTRLTTALQAFALDPRFKTITVDVQKQVDRFFTPQEKKRSGKGSPFQEANEEVAQIRERLEDLQRKKQGSDAAVASIDELRKSMDALSDARDVARTRLKKLDAALQAGASRLKAAAEFEKATQALAEIDSKIARAAAKSAEVAKLTAAHADASAQHQKGVVRLADLSAKLAGAKESLRDASSESAAAARELKKAALVTEAAKDDAEAAEAERMRTNAETAIHKAKASSAHEADLKAKRQQLQTTDEAIAKAEQDARDAGVMHGRLLAAYGFLKWKDCLTRVEKARGSLEAAAQSEKQAAEARAEAKSLQEEVAAAALPPQAEIKTIVDLEHQLQVAEAALGGGLSLTIRAKKELKLSASTDGGRAQKMSGTEATLDALRTIHLSIPDVADLEVSAGDEKSRNAVEQLKDRWNEAQLVLKRAGVTTPKALVELHEKVRARARSAEDRAQAAVQFEKDAARQRDEAAGLPALEKQASSYEADLTGHDQTMLAGLAAKLPGSAGDPTNTKEAKALAATVAAAEKAVSAGRTSKANLEGQLSQLEAKVEESKAASLAATRALEGKDPAAVLEAVAAKVKDLTARRQIRETTLRTLESGGDPAVAVARKAVDEAEAGLKAATKAQESVQGELESHRSRLDQARGQQIEMQKEADSLNRGAAVAELNAKKLALDGLPAAGATAADVEAARAECEKAEAALELKKDELRKAEGALSQVGGAVVDEQVEDYSAALAKAQERQADLESDASAWHLLRTVLRDCESVGVKHVGAALGEDVSRRFQSLAGKRYGGLAMDPHLKTLGVDASGERRVTSALSVGTRDQMATLLRLAIAESLGSVVVLDDHLAQTDVQRLMWFVDALKAAAKKIQVIVVTCRRRDYEAGAGDEITWVDLEQKIQRALTPA